MYEEWEFQWETKNVKLCLQENERQSHLKLQYDWTENYNILQATVKLQFSMYLLLGGWGGVDGKLDSYFLFNGINIFCTFVHILFFAREPIRGLPESC